MGIWKPIKNFEQNYEINNKGEVRTISHMRNNNNGEYQQKQKIRKPFMNHSGYFVINLSINGIVKTRRISRLVAETFISNPLNKPTVNHKDGNKLNNNIENLEWATRKEQTHHMHYVLGVPFSDCKIAKQKQKEQNKYRGYKERGNYDCN